MSSAPTLVMTEVEDLPEATDSTVKNVRLFPNDSREAMMSKLRESLAAADANSALMDEIRCLDEQYAMGTRLEDCVEDYYPEKHVSVQLPALNASQMSGGPGDYSELARFQQTISRYEDITCLDQTGSNGRVYYIFEEPFGKKLQITTYQNSGGQALVILNDAVCMSLKEFVSVERMEYLSNGKLKVSTAAGTVFEIPAASIPLMLHAIDKLSRLQSILAK